MHLQLLLTEAQLLNSIPLYREGMDWCPYTPTYTLSDSIMLQHLTAPDSKWWVAYNENNTMVGLVGYERIRLIDRIAEPFIAVLPHFRKKKLGHELAKLLFDKGLAELNLRRIQTTVLTDAPSIKLLLPFDFKREGVLYKARYKNGAYVNAEMYAWVRKE